jgi:spermidine synthase
MYHVIGTGSTFLILYLISYIFCRTGYYSLQFHRKLWNTLLLIAFVFTALAGLFMALQINYKWEIPITKSVLKWHVEFGIGMAFSGIFHLLWHLSYFGKMLKNNNDYNGNNADQKHSSKDIKANLFIVGFVSSAVQLLLLREIMNISGGYELITGVFLASWLTGSAIGAAMAGKSALNDISKINLGFSLSPLISLFLLIFFSRLFLSTGETPSFLLSMIYTFLVLTPFCLISGFTFVKLITIAGNGNIYTAGKSFSIETTGGVAAGITISILASGMLNSYQLILLIVILSLARVLLTYCNPGARSAIYIKIIISLLASVIIIFNPDIIFRQLLLPGMKVTASNDTSYGNITTGKYKNEKSIYYNQRLLAYNNDVTESEENIHYAMLGSDSPGKVILISGYLNSLLPEIFKYPVEKLIFIERDPVLALSGIPDRSTFPGEIVVANTDAFRYIRNSHEMADVVILLIPPPSTLLLNRYYTTEFFSEVKNKLNPGGIFMCSPGPGSNYFNRESINMYSSIYNSLSAVFKNVKPVVGNKLYFIASDKELSVSFCKLAESKKIRNVYVNSDFLDDDLISKKTDEVISLIDNKIRQNTFAFPIACFHFQSYNLSKNLNEKIPAIIIMLLVFVLPVVTIRRRNLLMYFSASALAGFEIILLLSLQVIVGNMYQLTGLIIAGLMTGLAVGSGMDIRFLNSVPVRLQGLILMSFYIVFGLGYNFIIIIKGGIPAIFLLIISGFLPALFTGHIFRKLTENTEAGQAAPSIYSSDLAGSALGFILLSGLVVPAFGIRVSIFLLSVLVFTGFLFGTIRSK